jgi:diguanylate cyclase (GGDEF)-like protein
MLQSSQPARVTLCAGAFPVNASLRSALVEWGWTVTEIVDLPTSGGELGLAIVPCGPAGPRIGAREATLAERTMLRRAGFLATVESSDRQAAEAATAAGAHGVLARDAAPALVEAQLRTLHLGRERFREAESHLARLQLLQTRVHVGFWELDALARWVRCTDSTAEMLGVEPRGDGWPLDTWITLFPSDCRASLAEWIESYERGREAPPFEHTLIDESGMPFRARHVGRADLDPSGRCLRVTAMAESLGAHGVEDANARDAGGRMLDSSRFLHDVEVAVRQAGRTGQHVAVLYLDVHRVRSLTAGNLSSDAAEHLLATVATRVREGIRESDAIAHRKGGRGGAVIARWAGDHFTMLLPDLVRIHDAAKVATRILELLSQPFEISGRELCVPASIGIAGFPTDHHSAEELVRRAETASYSARQEGHGSLKFYSAALDAKAFERLTLETSLRRALERNELQVYYQPRVEVRTERIVGFEALLRWKHPELGFISPGQFIPLAEESGLIVPIGDWVLREAARQNKEWQDSGLAPVRMAVNLSSVQFSHSTLLVTIKEALESSGLDAQWLELELTESTVMRDPGSVVETLARIKGAGIHLSIDDFGTGYSSLAYLKRFPIDALKIDQSFIRESTSNPDDAAIVTSILLMARSLKLGVVAEGVETESQLSFLRVMQCDEVQGYLFSPPVPADKARLLLERGFERRTRAA